MTAVENSDGCLRLTRVADHLDVRPLSWQEIKTPYPRVYMLRALFLLTVSNVFMTFAWYGHLKHTSRALPVVVVVSWGIAFFEYCFQVPANRIGYAAGMSAAELKTMQEVVTLVVFAVFATLYLREPLRWSTIAGFVLIALGAGLVYGPWGQDAPVNLPASPGTLP